MCNFRLFGDISGSLQYSLQFIFTRYQTQGLTYTRHAEYWWFTSLVLNLSEFYITYFKGQICLFYWMVHVCLKNQNQTLTIHNIAATTYELSPVLYKQSIYRDQYCSSSNFFDKIGQLKMHPSSDCWGNVLRVLRQHGMAVMPLYRITVFCS